MGFQLLNIITSHNQSVLSHDAFDSEDLPLPLHLAPDAKSSRFISAAPSDVLTWLTTENITVNLHHDGVTPESFTSNEKLSAFYQLISTNKGRDGHVSRAAAPTVSQHTRHRVAATATLTCPPPRLPHRREGLHVRRCMLFWTGTPSGACTVPW